MVVIIEATALKRPEKTIERLLIKFTCCFKAILDVIDNPKQTQKTTAIGTLFLKTS